MSLFTRKRGIKGDGPTPLPLVDDPGHPALTGQYARGKVHRINYYRERRRPWEAVELFLTLRCPIACRHCITNSHPDRPDVMPKDLLLALIEGLADLGRTQYVCLFGGEPLLEMDLLETGIAACRRRRLLPSSATCGLWAHTSREARACARRLRGLNHLLLSTDRFHLEFIDLHDVIRAMEACVAEGINTSVNYVAEADEFTGADCIPTELTKAARRLGVGIVVTPCSAAGRAASAQNLVVPIAPSMPCGKLDVPLFDCMGNAFACGPGWTIPGEGDSRWELGRFPQRALNDLFHRAYSSPIFHGLRNLGPLATERRIAEENGTPSDRLGLEPLSSPCGTCQRIARSFSAGARFAGSTGAPCSIPSRNS